MNKKLLFSAFLVVVTNYAMEHRVKTADFDEIKEIDTALEHLSIDEKDKAVDILANLRVKKIERLDSHAQLNMFLELATSDGGKACEFLIYADKFDANATDDIGTPVLLRCIDDNCDENIIGALLARNANVKAHLIKPKRAPLLSAAMLCNAAVAKVLLDHGADASVTTDGSETPLRIAIAQVQKNVGEGKIDTAKKFGELVSLFLKSQKNYSNQTYFNDDIGHLASSFDSKNILGTIYKKYLESV